MSVRLSLLAVILAGAYVVASTENRDVVRHRVKRDMEFALPGPAQILLAGGDRYLAANIGAFRAVTVGVFPLPAETYRVLANVQDSASALNPYHEDNYYTAAAILAWNDQLDTAQTILARARTARTSDALPPFFHGFNRYYFYEDYAGAAKDMALAAARSEGGNRIALNNLAAKWFERTPDPTVAIRLIEGIKAGARDPQLQAILDARIVRLQAVQQLRAAAADYTRLLGKPLAKLDDLVSSGLLPALPADPFGAAYVIDERGYIDVARPKGKVARRGRVD